MRSRLMLAVLFLASVPAFSQNFNLVFTGGAVKFGAAPLDITVAPNSPGTQGIAKSGPAPCGTAKAVTLAGAAPFVIHGTTTVGGHQWEIVFKFQGGANQGNLSASSANWELTGHYLMMITDVTTHAVCSKVVGASGEYQLAGPALGGWPHINAKSCNTPGQSPGLTGALALRGHANIFPIFAPGGACTAALAAEANSKIGGKGFDTVNLDYRLSY